MRRQCHDSFRGEYDTVIPTKAEFCGLYTSAAWWYKGRLYSGAVYHNATPIQIGWEPRGSSAARLVDVEGEMMASALCSRPKRPMTNQPRASPWV